MNTVPTRRSWTRSALLALLASCAVAGARASAAPPYDLKPIAEAGQLRQVAVRLEVGGELLINSDGKELKLPMNVEARLKHQERLLSGDDATAAPNRSVRYYDLSDVTIRVENQPYTRKLREERRLLAVVRGSEELTIACPAGPISRDELDIVAVPADSLAIDGLLPDEPVRPGDTWKVSDAALTVLLGLDTVGQCDVEGMLIEVDKQRAQLDYHGTVHGAVLGVATVIDLKVRAYYALDGGGLNDVELVYKEKRAAGHAAPGVDVTAKVRTQLAPLSESSRLTDANVARVPKKPSADDLRLQYESPRRQFRLLTERNWHIVREDSESSVLRLVDRGELVAQCNIKSLSPLRKDRRTTLAKFQEDIRKSLGENLGELVAASENQDPSGRLVYRVDAAGKVSDLPIHWVYYLVQDAEGRRATLVFTLEEPLLKRFAAADRPLIDSLEMLSPPSASDSKPTPSEQAAAPKPPVPPVEKSVTRKKPDVAGLPPVPSPPPDSDGKSLRRAGTERLRR